MSGRENFKQCDTSCFINWTIQMIPFISADEYRYALRMFSFHLKWRKMRYSVMSYNE